MEKQYDNNDDLGDKVEFITTVALKLADIIKDPTDDGKKTLDADARNKIREDSYHKLCSAIESLSSLANFYISFNSLINIGADLQIEKIIEKKCI